MNQLELIEQKIAEKEILSIGELKYLYILSKFNKEENEKATKIISIRDTKKDLAEIFDCKTSDICLPHEINYSQNYFVFYGNLRIIDMFLLKDFKFPKIVLGNLNLEKTKRAINTKFPEQILGSVYLQSLEKIENCTMPKIVKGDFFLNSYIAFDKASLLAAIPDIIEGRIITYYGIFKTKQDIDKALNNNLENIYESNRKR